MNWDESPVPLTGEVAQREFITIWLGIAAALAEIHGVESRRHWEMASFWFAFEATRAPSVPGKCTTYDNRAFKAMVRGGQYQAKFRGPILNCLEIVALELRDLSRPLSSRDLWTGSVRLLKLLVQYTGYRITGVRKRKKVRSRAVVMSTRLPRPLREIVAAIPRCYLEDYEFYSGIDVKINRAIEGPKVQNGLGVAYATRILTGAKTLLEQHGSGYGEIQGVHQLESRSADVFMTWGWKYSEKHCPGPSKRLTGFVRSYRTPLDNMGSALGALIVLPSYFWGTSSVEVCTHFLISLNKINQRINGSHRIEIRQRLTSNKRVDKIRHAMLQSVINEHAPFVKIDTEESAVKSVRRSHLMVCLEHPSTLFVSGVAANHPTIALIRPDTPYLPEYRQPVRDLLDLQIMHKTVGGAAEAAMRPEQEIQQWWKAVKSDKRYERYRKTYCRTSVNSSPSVGLTPP